MISKKQIKILIVEDEALISEDIKDICELSGYTVPTICYNGHQAITTITSTHFDLGILDINLESELTGFDIAEFIRLQNIQLPYIFLTSYSDSATLNTAKNCNPLAYITKPFRKEQLISTLEISLSKVLNIQKEKTEISLDISEPIRLLSDREYEIAKMICDGKSNEEIATRLCISVNTIKYHIKNMYEKLGIKNRIQLLKIIVNK